MWRTLDVSGRFLVAAALYPACSRRLPEWRAVTFLSVLKKTQKSLHSYSKFDPFSFERGEDK
jgi:hypothetical protein